MREGSQTASRLKHGSVWGSQIVKGFTENKTRGKPHPNEVNASVVVNKVGVPPSDCGNEQNHLSSYSSRVKRSLIGEFPRSVNAAQVHPHAGTTDLFVELDHLRNSLKEARDRGEQWKNETFEWKAGASELEEEVEAQRNKAENLAEKLSLVEDEKSKLLEQVASLTEVLGEDDTDIDAQAKEVGGAISEARKVMFLRRLELEVVELRRLNKELQQQKRELSFRLSNSETQLASLAKITESDIVAKVEAQASKLRYTNEDLCKQVEVLQMSRFTEVEELVYLRWVNSCLRYELRKSGDIYRHPSALDLSETMSPQSHETAKKLMLEYSKESHICKKENNIKTMPSSCSMSESEGFPDLKNVCLLQRFRKLSKMDDDCQAVESQYLSDKDLVVCPNVRSPRRRHSISGSKDYSEKSILSRRRQTSGSIAPGALDSEAYATIKCSQNQETVPTPAHYVNRTEVSKLSHVEIEKRTLRIPNPPPRPSNPVPIESEKDKDSRVPLPPPPPPKFSTKNSTSVVQRAPEVVEFYHSLMKRDSRKESSGGLCDVQNVANVRSSMIGEIENRSAHLLAIKADVETQGEFVRSLMREVKNAVYNDIEDVVAFVNWLDEELGFLVDERAVLKHFEWPELKADALREAAFSYRDLKKLEYEVSSYVDDVHLPCDASLKKMLTLSEKMERGVNNILRNRESMFRHCKEFHIPTNWMLDNGLVSKIKFSSVRLAKKYMKRVAVELQSMGGASEKGPALEYMLLQGVRFAFRMHQFAGGFDVETMHAFEELRDLARIRKE
ncbi:unnamed protein product [Victoria cruziana]